MKDGFIKVASVAPELRLADCGYNAERILEAARQAAAQGAKLLITPELSITGYTCADLFFQKTLLDSAEQALEYLRRETAGLELLLAVGMPVRHLGKLFNCGVMLYQGEILGVVPKVNLCNYEEFYESRIFQPAPKGISYLCLGGEEYAPFGPGQRFACRENPDFTVGLEICEDLWVPVSPAAEMCRQGATIIGNLCASHDGIGRVQEHQILAVAQSQKLRCGYILSVAGPQESTGDQVFSGQQIICENGEILTEKKPFETGLAITEIDVQRLAAQRRKTTTYPAGLRALFHDADGDEAHPEDRKGSLPAGGPGGAGGGMPAYLPDAEPCPGPPAGAYPCKSRGGWRLRRTGFHPDPSGLPQGHGAAGPEPGAGGRRHHALLRHHQPHPQQCGAFVPGAGHPHALHPHRRRGGAAFCRHRP